MGFADDAKFVLFGKKPFPERERFTLTDRAISNDFGLGDLDNFANFANERPQPKPRQEPSSNRSNLIRALSNMRLEVFSVSQVAGYLKANKTQIHDLLDDLVADGILDRIPGRQGFYTFSNRMRQPDFNPPPERNSQINSQYGIDELRKMIQDQLFVLNKKIDFWASRIDTKNEIETKKKVPNKVIAEFKGKILEIINTLKVIEMPGSDRDLGDLIIQYKDARREQLYMKERELGFEVIDRLDAMVSVYLHLVRVYTEFNKYLLDLYREGVIQSFENEEEPPAQPAMQQPKQAQPRPSDRAPPRPPTQPQQGGEENADLSQFDEGGEEEFADEQLDDNTG